MQRTLPSSELTERGVGRSFPLSTKEFSAPARRREFPGQALKAQDRLTRHRAQTHIVVPSCADHRRAPVYGWAVASPEIAVIFTCADPSAELGTAGLPPLLRPCHHCSAITARSPRPAAPRPRPALAEALGKSVVSCSDHRNINILTRYEVVEEVPSAHGRSGRGGRFMRLVQTWRGRRETLSVHQLWITGSFSRFQQQNSRGGTGRQYRAGMAAQTHSHTHSGSAHTHDGIDWMARLAQLRRADEVDAPAIREVAERLVDRTPPGSTVLDVGSGAGGMSVALVEALSRRGGGTVVLVDATAELLDAAAAAARAAAAEHGDRVAVDTVLADLADEASLARIPKARLVWASHVVHHLPDQQQTLASLAGLLVAGGCLAIAEGGLPMRCLPWDIGLGEPGLQDRLTTAQSFWFNKMRAEMPGSVVMPVGWNLALAEAGLVGVNSFSYLIDRPAPAPEVVRDAVLNWLQWMQQITEDQLSESDADTVRHLIDPADAGYLANRQDVFLLAAHTVHLGWSR